jgi:hypothetical protein
MAARHHNMLHFLVPFILLLLFGNSTRLYAGAWTLPRGSVWTKLAWYTLNTDHQYADIAGIFPGIGEFEPGNRVPYANEGKSLSRAFFMDIVYGVTDRWDIGVTIPFYQQEFIDNVSRSRGQDTERSGFSDIMGQVKFRIMARPFVLTVLSEIKFPTGEFVNIDGVVPVGEGQTDIAFAVSAGTSFWPLPGYTNIEAGWRIRTTNTDANFDPGDEFYTRWEAGYTLWNRLQGTLKFYGLFGRPSRFGLAIAQQTRKRQIVYLSPEIGYRLVHNWMAGAGVNIPLKGRSYPAGRQYFLSLSANFTL